MPKMTVVCMLFIATTLQAQVDKLPVAYPYVREADMFWVRRVWRVIDFREKMNQSFYYPPEPAQGRVNFLTMVLSALKEGTLIAYSPMDDEFKKPLNWSELKNSFYRKDTVLREDPLHPGMFEDTVLEMTIDFSKVKKLRLKEEWFVDKQRSMLEVRILGFCPVMDAVDEAGNYKGTQPLFWINFEQARPVLAKTLVYNPRNDALCRNWDEIFALRYFSSYVIKVSNVFDRYISEYASGMDAMLEAEKVKDDIFDFEQSLWEH